ncbi:hypothetical protein VHARVF571_610008 [Vibrio harveyi]|nr:hypothetical protein VHARVF571_610008 [Vibrio harveyi]
MQFEQIKSPVCTPNILSLRISSDPHLGQAAFFALAISSLHITIFLEP